MRQASWIAFLLFTVGLVTYEAAIDQPDASDSTSISSDAPAEGGGDFPPPKP
jgi:hypothetical protein